MVRFSIRIYFPDMLRFSIRIDFSNMVRLDRIGMTDTEMFIILDRIDLPLNLNHIGSDRLTPQI